jgi:hypothetical protein
MTTRLHSAVMRCAVIASTATAMIASPAAFAASTASAAAPVPVSIQATVTQFFPTFSGVWTASGAINDSGTFVRTDLNSTGSLEHSPVVGALQVQIVFTSSQGTITVRDELLGTATSLTGNWQIASGTGAYLGINGHGVSEFVPPTIVFTGVMSPAD